MSIEIIKVISEAEEKAEVLKKEALSKAKHIITEANAEATRILEDARLYAESSSSEVISIAESEGQILYDNKINNASKECENILKKADKYVDKAASIILERIVRVSGNS